MASFRVWLKICGSIMHALEDVVLFFLDVLAQIDKFDLRRL
ncbi:hypothetical protein [Ruegeria atlantica]|nr:hypothetical protein [Ruegeria atlantica]